MTEPELRALAARDATAKAAVALIDAERERAGKAEAALAACINDGTDGFALPGVSLDFLLQAPLECAAIKRQRDAEREVVETLREALRECHALLGAALSQRLPSDDKIIMDHVEDAARVIAAAMGAGEIKQPPTKRTP